MNFVSFYIIDANKEIWIMLIIVSVFANLY